MRLALVLAVAWLAVALPTAAQEGAWRTPDLDARTMQRLYRGEPAGRFIERRVTGGQTEFYSRARAGSGWLCEAERLRVTTVQDRSGRLIRSAAMQTIYRSPPSGGCSSLGPGALYFTAPDGESANLAVDALNEVIRARRARSRPLFNTECEPDCDFLLTLEGSYPAIRSVERIAMDTPEARGASRVTVRIDGPGAGYEISVTLRQGAEPLRQRILSATARPLS